MIVSILTAFVLGELPSGREAWPQALANNGYGDYLSAVAAFPEGRREAVFGLWDSKGETGWLDRVKAVLRRESEVLALVERGNLRPVVHPDLATMDYGASFPEGAAFRAIGILFQMRAHERFARGDVPGGHRDWLSLLRFGRRLQGSGVGILSLHGVLISENAFRELAGGVPFDVASCGLVQREATTMLAESPVPSLIQGKWSSTKNQIVKIGELAAAGLVFSAEELERLPEDSKVAAVREYVSHGDALVSRMRGLGALEPVEGLAAMKKLREDLSGTDAVTRALVAEWEFAWNQTLFEAECRTKIRMARLRAAIWAFRWERGVLPTSLEEVGDAGLTRDWLSGRDFEFEVGASGFEVWTAGVAETGEIRFGHWAPMPGLIRGGSAPTLPPVLD